MFELIQYKPDHGEGVQAPAGHVCRRRSTSTTPSTCRPRRASSSGPSTAACRCSSSAGATRPRSSATGASTHYVDGARRGGGRGAPDHRQPRRQHVGLCSGGMTMAGYLGYLAARGGSARWPTSRGRCACSTCRAHREHHARPVQHAGVGEGGQARARAARAWSTAREMARMFAWLRPNDLIWNYWVNNYLLGNKPPAFDILAWNADTTRLPAGFHCRPARPDREATRIVNAERARPCAARRSTCAR